jgi:hypothetical protein
MARTRCTFTQEAVTRAIRAAIAAGVQVRVEIERDGKIVLIPIGEPPTEPAIVPAKDIVL